jgi:hypothetical protein
MLQETPHADSLGKPAPATVSPWPSAMGENWSANLCANIVSQLDGYPLGSRAQKSNIKLKSVP